VTSGRFRVRATINLESAVDIVYATVPNAKRNDLTIRNLGKSVGIAKQMARSGEEKTA
jgi:hypothetical protein